MPIPADRLYADGSLRAFFPAEVGAIDIRTRDIRDGSGLRFHGNQNQETAEFSCSIAGGQLDNAKILMLGAAVVFTNPLTGRAALSRLVPAPLPRATHLRGVELTSTKGFQFTSDARTAATGGQFDIPQFSRLDTGWLYQSLPFDVRTDAEANFDEALRYVQELPTTTDTQFLTLAGSAGMQYRTQAGGGADGKPVPFNVGYTITTSVASWKWHRVPKAGFAPGSILRTRLLGDPGAGTIGLIGTVNKTAFFGYPAGTLLLLDPETEIAYDQASSAYCYNVTFKAQFKARGHLFLPFFDPAAGGAITGWYYINNRGFFAVADTPDNSSIFNVREWNGINGVFSVG